MSRLDKMQMNVDKPLFAIACFPKARKQTNLFLILISVMTIVDSV